MQVALLQTPVCTDATENLRVAADAVRRAAIQGAQIAVLPEMFCCPYDAASFSRNAEPDGGARWQLLRQLSRASGLYLVAGSVPELHGNAIYNTAYVFTPDGGQLAKYRKMHLFDISINGGLHFRESDTLTAGNDVCVFDTPFGRCGLMICYDIRFPEYAQRIAKAGAEVLFIPAWFNWTTGPAHWELLFRARAMDNQMFTVGVASALDSADSTHSYGHSIVVSPWGEVLAQMDAQPGLRLVSLDMTQPAALHAQMPFAAHRAARITRVGF